MKQPTTRSTRLFLTVVLLAAVLLSACTPKPVIPVVTPSEGLVKIGTLIITNTTPQGDGEVNECWTSTNQVLNEGELMNQMTLLVIDRLSNAPGIYGLEEIGGKKTVDGIEFILMTDGSVGIYGPEGQTCGGEQ